MNNPNPQTEPSNPVQPQTPNEDQELSPNRPDVEVNPGIPGNNTEVDLDKTKIPTYPPAEH